jgi:membrane protein DedA with SNARE-associated domain
VSPSKKANNNAPTKRAQRESKKTSARASRVTAIEVREDSTKAEPTSASQVAQTEADNEPGSSKFLTNILRILALLAVVAITVYIYSIREHVEEFAALGYPGIFLIALLANATILLPAPGLAIIYAMGAIFNPLGVGLAAGTGGAIGELSGYLAGFSGQAVVERMDVYDRVKPWLDKYGGWAIMVLSAIPNPFFDVAGIAAGMAKMPVQTFLLFIWIGQLIKMTIFALAGKYSIHLLTNFIR